MRRHSPSHGTRARCGALHALPHSTATAYLSIPFDRKIPSDATNIQRWVGRVLDVSGRRGTRSVTLRVWARDDAAMNAMRWAQPGWSLGNAEGDMTCETVECFGAVTLRGRIKTGGVVFMTVFQHAEHDRVIIQDISAPLRDARRARGVGREDR